MVLCGRDWRPVVSRPALPRLVRAIVPRACSRAPQRHTDASCVLSYVKSCSTRNGSTVRRSVGSAINKPIDVLSRFKSAKSEAQLQSDPERGHRATRVRQSRRLARRRTSCTRRRRVDRDQSGSNRRGSLPSSQAHTSPTAAADRDALQQCLALARHASVSRLIAIDVWLVMNSSQPM